MIQCDLTRNPTHSLLLSLTGQEAMGISTESSLLSKEPNTTEQILLAFLFLYSEKRRGRGKLGSHLALDDHEKRETMEIRPKIIEMEKRKDEKENGIDPTMNQIGIIHRFTRSENWVPMWDLYSTSSSVYSFTNHLNNNTIPVWGLRPNITLLADCVT